MSGEDGPPEPLHFCETTNISKDPCNAQWLLLWTYAAYVDEIPNENQKADAKMFYNLFQDQCKNPILEGKYSQFVKQTPPKVESRRELMQWLSYIENQCRQSAKVPLKTFRYKDLMERWRYQDGYL